MKKRGEFFSCIFLCISGLTNAQKYNSDIQERFSIWGSEVKVIDESKYLIDDIYYKDKIWGSEINVIDEKKYLLDDIYLKDTNWGSEINVIDESQYLLTDTYLKDNIWGSEVNIINEEDYLYIDWFKNKYNKSILLKNTDVKNEQEIIILNENLNSSQLPSHIEIKKAKTDKKQTKPIKTKKEENKIIEFSDEDVVILSVKLKKYFLTDSLVAYLNKEEVYIPLSDFFEIISFPITISKDNKTASGFFLNKERKFNLDIENKKIISDNKKYEILENEIKEIDGILYAKHTSLSKWFPLDIKFKLNDLMLYLNSEEPMPIEIEKEIELRRKYINKNTKKFEQNLKTKNIIEINDKFSKPSFDLTLSHNINKGKDHSTKSTNYYINASNIMFGYDTSYYLYGGNGSNTKLRLKAQKYQPFNNDNFLKDIEFGDTKSSSIPLISNSSMGRGIYFSSSSNSRISANKTININGFLPDGYEVELYKNGNIIDFITNSQNGMYEFSEVPVSTGLNIFKLVFIGPYGEQREEEKRIYVSPSSVKSGEFELTGSITQNNNVLIDLDKENTDSNNIKTNLQLLYGINSSIAVSLGFSQDENIKNNNEINTFIQSGFLFALPFGSIETYIAKNNDKDKTAYSISMTNNLWGWTLFSKYDDYNNIESTPSYFSGEFADDMVEFKLNGRISIPYIGNIPTYSRYRKYNFYNESIFEKLSAEETVIRFSYPLKRMNIGLEYNSTSYFSGNETSDTSLKAIYKLGIASIKGEYIYNIKPTKNSSLFSLRSDFKVNNDISYYSEWQHYYTNKTDNFLIGLNRKTDIGSFSLGFSYNTSSEKAILLSYNIGLLANQKSPGYNIHGNNNTTTSGSARLKAFLDTNANNLFDDDEKPLENIKIQTSTINKNKQLTNANGELIISGLSISDINTFKINTDKLEDISFTPVNEEYHFISRIGYLKDIEIPIIQIGELETSIYTTKKSKSQPLKGIIIKIVDNNGKEIKQGVSATDGSIIISRIPYGEYEIKFDNQQLKDLNLKTSKENIKLKVNEAFTYIDPIKLTKTTSKKNKKG